MARGKRTPEAMREARVKAQTQRRAIKEALAPLWERVQALIEEYERTVPFEHARRMNKYERTVPFEHARRMNKYERTVPFEHARRMNKLLHSVVRAAEIALKEAEKDLARISKGMNPCQPSVLRQRLSDLLEGF